MIWTLHQVVGRRMQQVFESTVDETVTNECIASTVLRVLSCLAPLSVVQKPLEFHSLVTEVFTAVPGMVSSREHGF